MLFIIIENLYGIVPFVAFALPSKYIYGSQPKGNELKIVGIIQARLESSRLPAKMMLCLHGHPIIEWVVRRVGSSRKLDSVVAAIPESKDNDYLAKYILSLGTAVHRGSENDVLGRIYKAATYQEATHVVRICADNPLISGEEIDRLIEFYMNHPCDYAYNHIPKGNTYPDGFGAEIVSYELLGHIYRAAIEKCHREHCLSFIADNPGQFDIRTFNPPEDISGPDLRFDIDTFDDYCRLSSMDFTIETTTQEIVKLFRKMP